MNFEISESYDFQKCYNVSAFDFWEGIYNLFKVNKYSIPLSSNTMITIVFQYKTEECFTHGLSMAI